MAQAAPRASAPVTAILALLVCSLATADERPEPNEPQIAEASNEGELAIQRFKIPDGFEMSLVAAEPMLANPVAFGIDAQGRFLICETFRQQKGVEDNRSHMVWLDDDLALQSVEERLEMFRKHLGDAVNDYAKEDDRIRLLTDRDGDGKVDQATVFAKGFNGILDGTGAGVLAWHGQVYYTCIPEMWKLADTNGDGVADERESLHHGYGIRVAFRGHDMHGLVMGPDGRIYYSIGDRGYNVVSKEGKTFKRPDTGAVFRCLPDGSQLEVFAYGLRNPQELAFDDQGNLFTGDNNSDSGDQARWVYVVRGGDTGWRMYYQYLKDRGPFNREKIWHPKNDDQPAYIVPPIINLADGPSGLTYYPGVGLPERYKGHFFLADFRGNAANSGIRSFAVKPKGASFELVDSHQFLWQVLATDIDFGYDGSMYLTDWVQGWDGPGKGRLYRLTNPTTAGAAGDEQIATLMSEGFAKRNTDELAALLTHPDKRIRQEAQFALVDKGAATELTKIASVSQDQLARLHAIWGLGQLARSERPMLVAELGNLIGDSDHEVAAQSINTIGDIISTYRAFGAPEGVELNKETIADLDAKVAPALIQALQHKNARVQYFAAQALGHRGMPDAVAALLELLDRNNNEDAVIRHGAVMGLTGIGKSHPDALLAVLDHSGPAGRLGLVLALRRLKHNEVARFLADGEPRIVLEAARAIHDEPLNDVMPALADLGDQTGLEDPLLRRVMNANYRLGGIENLKRVTAFAADRKVDEVLRLEALEELKTWTDPDQKDRVLGDWRPLDKRSSDGIADVLRPALGGLLTGSDKVRTAAASIAARYGIKQVGPTLAKLLKDPKSTATVRVEALRALNELEFDGIEDLAMVATSATSARLRSEGLRVLASVNPDAAIPKLVEALEGGETVERQLAIQTLSTLKREDSDSILRTWLTRLVRRDVPAEIQLDLLTAADTRKEASGFAKLVEEFEKTRDADDHLGKYREAMAGGDAQRGYDIFYGRSAASCRRCHQIGGSGGNVGPNLSKIGKDKKREYLLEAIVDPNKQIAKGFETVILAMDDGKVHAGIIKEETDESISLMKNDGAIVVLKKDEIDDRAAGQSGMPADLIKHLSKADIRDLVEYLAIQDGTAKSAEAHGEGE